MQLSKHGMIDKMSKRLLDQLEETSTSPQELFREHLETVEHCRSILKSNFDLNVHYQTRDEMGFDTMSAYDDDYKVSYRVNWEDYNGNWKSQRYSTYLSAIKGVEKLMAGGIVSINMVKEYRMKVQNA